MPIEVGACSASVTGVGSVMRTILQRPGPGWQPARPRAPRPSGRWPTRPGSSPGTVRRNAAGAPSTSQRSGDARRANGRRTSTGRTRSARPWTSSPGRATPPARPCTGPGRRRPRGPTGRGPGPTARRSPPDRGPTRHSPFRSAGGRPRATPRCRTRWVEQPCQPVRRPARTRAGSPAAGRPRRRHPAQHPARSRARLRPGQHGRGGRAQAGLARRRRARPRRRRRGGG